MEMTDEGSCLKFGTIASCISPSGTILTFTGQLATLTVTFQHELEMCTSDAKDSPAPATMATPVTTRTQGEVKLFYVYLSG